MEQFKNYLKIPLIQNSKVPAVKGWHLEEYTTKEVLTQDIGILTGRRNNLLVLDIDIKDDGLQEIDNYIKKFGDINTFTLQTPSGGYHYYFKYKCKDADKQYLIDNYITNSTKYRNKGLDIRTNGGYVKKYNNIYKNVEIEEIPETLLLWLLEDVQNFEKDVKATKPINNKQLTNKSNFKYNITEEQFKTFLNSLDKMYNDNYNKWLLVLTISKNLLNTFDTYDIFNNYSKQNKKKYNKTKNDIFWFSNKGNIDINYLIYRNNREQNTKKELIEKYKPYDIELNMSAFENININKIHLEYEQAIFDKTQALILESTTGTGKTTSTAKYAYKYIQANPQIKFLSIVNLIKLNEQQLKTFKDEGLMLYNYQECSENELKNKNICICLNSINKKLNWLDAETLKNYIVYIDEVSSFIDSLLYNDNLNNNLKYTYQLLMRIIKHCHKLILSDAILTPNVLKLIEKRDTPEKLYIKNTFKKYNGIEAIKQNDENEFLNKIKKHIEDDNYFLFGADSKSSITKYCNELMKHYPDKVDKFLLITADTSKKITNANKLFKNKFVFFSPSITTGINFNIFDKQDVFIYIKGKTIRPASSFQQATRTRNINKLYYYSNAKEQQPKYSDVLEVETNFKQMIEINNKLLNISGNMSHDDETIIIDNTFFKLFCEGVYQTDTEGSNKLLHFENILDKQGFILKSEGIKQELNKDIKKQMTTELNDNKDAKYKQFVVDAQDETKNVYEMPEYKTFLDRQNYLLIDETELNEYEFLMNDEFKYNNYFTFKKMFYKTELLQEKQKDSNNADVKKIDDVITKILLLRKFEADNNILPFDINFLTSPNLKLNLNNDTYKHLSKLFRISKGKPTNNEELKKLYVGMLRHLFNNLDIINSKKTKQKGMKANEIRKNITNYEFDDKILNKLFKICLRGKKANYDEILFNIFNVKLPQKDIDDGKYLFKGKA